MMKRLLVMIACLGFVLGVITLHPALAAQNSPFGVSSPEAPIPVGGDFLRQNLGWIYQMQAGFYKQLTGIVKQAKEDGSAVWLLIGLSFLYGVFHAAGPGHGKVVISSYMLANEQSARRGMVISFLAAFLQGLVAVGLIGAAFFVFKLTSVRLTQASHAFEQASYLLITALGLYLLWQKAVQPLLRPRIAIAAHEVAHAHAHAHAHEQAHRPHHAGCGCGGHAAEPATLDKALTLRSAWAAIFSVGLRPCSGALIVLVFAAAQGLFGVGVVSVFAMALGTAITVSFLAAIAVGAKSFALRYLGIEGQAGWVFKGVEVLGASLVFLLGSTLLAASLLQ